MTVYIIVSIFYSDRISLPPDYNPNAMMENKLYDVKRVSELCPVRPPNDELVDTRTWECEVRNNDSAVALPMLDTSEQQFMPEHPKMKQIRKISSGEFKSVANYYMKSVYVAFGTM